MWVGWDPKERSKRVTSGTAPAGGGAWQAGSRAGATFEPVAAHLLRSLLPLQIDINSDDEGAAGGQGLGGGWVAIG